jgi:hypothetical protein
MECGCWCLGLEKVKRKSHQFMDQRQFLLIFTILAQAFFVSLHRLMEQLLVRLQISLECLFFRVDFLRFALRLQLQPVQLIHSLDQLVIVLEIDFGQVNAMCIIL